MTPGVNQNDELTKKERELSELKTGKQEDIYTLLECHVNLDLEGFEDKDDELNPTGIKLPYIVTVEEAINKFYLLDVTMNQLIQREINPLFCPL